MNKVILNIDKKIENNTLTVEITCPERKFLSHEIKLLTTENVMDLLKNNKKIQKKNFHQKKKKSLYIKHFLLRKILNYLIQ